MPLNYGPGPIGPEGQKPRVPEARRVSIDRVQGREAQQLTAGVGVWGEAPLSSPARHGSGLNVGGGTTSPVLPPHFVPPYRTSGKGRDRAKKIIHTK